MSLPRASSKLPQESLRLILCLGIGLALAAPAWADDADGVQMSLQQQGIWDSNPLMRTQGREAIYGSTTTPGLSYQETSDLTRFMTKAWVDENLFDKTSFNSTDFHGQTTFTQKNERWEATLKNTLAYDTTRTSELTNYGLDVGSTRHFAYTVEPSVFYSPTHRDSLGLSSSFEKDVYESDLYSGYTVVDLSPAYKRSLTPLTSALFSLDAQRYQSEKEPKRRVDSLGPSIGIETSLTPKWLWNVSGGAQESRQFGQGIDTSDWVWHYIFGNTLTFKGEDTNVTFKATRTRLPASNSTESLLSTLSVDVAQKLNKRFTLTGGLSYRYATYDEPSSNNLDTMVVGEVGLSYHLTKELDLTTNVRYRDEALTGTDKTANESIGHIGLLYHCNWADTLF